MHFSSFFPGADPENRQPSRAKLVSPVRYLPRDLSICPSERHLTWVRCRVHSHQHAATYAQKIDSIFGPFSPWQIASGPYRETSRMQLRLGNLSC